MKLKPLVLGILLTTSVGILSLTAADESSKRSITFSTPTMGTYGDLILIAADSLAARDALCTNLPAAVAHSDVEEEVV